jgi:hypothetical protein
MPVARMHDVADPLPQAWYEFARNRTVYVPGEKTLYAVLYHWLATAASTPFKLPPGAVASLQPLYDILGPQMLPSMQLPEASTCSRQQPSLGLLGQYLHG